MTSTIFTNEHKMDSQTVLHKRVAVREGRRMSALAAAYSSAIKYAMMGVDEEAFAAHFPDTNPDLLEILWQGYRQALHGSRVHIESDFDTLCEEAALPDKLHQLEELCQMQGIPGEGHGSDETALSETASGRPTHAVRAALLAARKAEVEQLETILKAVVEVRQIQKQKLEQKIVKAEEACRKLRPLTTLDTNVSRACIVWESHKAGPAVT